MGWIIDKTDGQEVFDYTHTHAVPPPPPMPVPPPPPMPVIEGDDPVGLVIAVGVLIAMIVLSAISAKGMYQLGCSKNLSAFGFFLYSLLNTVTFGIFGIVNAYSFRNAQFEMKSAKDD